MLHWKAAAVASEAAEMEAGSRVPNCWETPGNDSSWGLQLRCRMAMRKGKGSQSSRGPTLDTLLL